MKIFGVGLRKTGVTSLKAALSILGYEIIQSPKGLVSHSNSNLKLNFENYDSKDGLIDDPIPLFYQEIDKIFPDAKFILTTRGLEKWLNSVEYHFSRTRSFLRGFLSKDQQEYILKKYGAQVFDKKKYKKTFLEHEKQVINYFSGRENDLLVYSIKEGWKPLCNFLNKKIPNFKIPHKNKKTSLRNRILSCV